MAVLNSEGTTFEVESAVSGVWNAICIRDLTGIGGGQATVKDRTTLCSSAKEKGMGLPDEGSPVLSAFYDPAGVGIQRMITLRAAQELGAFRVVLTDTGSETRTFSAYVLSAELGGFTPDSDVTINFAMEISGLITIA